MLTTRKPGPPVPPRPSAAAVANALAKHRENSPSQQQQQQFSGVHTLKPPHPGRTVVYKSPAFDQVKKPQNDSKESPQQLGGPKTEVYVGESHGYNNVPRPILPPAPPPITANSNSSLENGKLMYTSTCSIIEINSSSSASTSASSSPVSTLQKTDSKANLQGGGRTDQHRNHFNSADEDDTCSQKQLKNTYNHRFHLLDDPLDHGDDVIAIKRNSPDVIVINSASSSSEHDSGTEQNSIDTNSIASSNSLERENNLKNLENRTAHMTEIIIGSGSDLSTTTVVTNGTSTIIEARNDGLLNPTTTNHVIRSSSIRLPYRPEPEGGEHVTPPLNDTNVTNLIKVIKPIDPTTIDSKLSEKKVAFHELLISELTAMRSAQENLPPDSISRRQRCPPENRSSPEISPNGTARIRTADWIEVGDNGKEVVLSSCQISLEDSGLEDEEKLDDASSGVGDSWDSVKDAEERITMSLPGLPPLPKSLSGFDLAGQQLQSHQQHHHQNHHHHQQHHPPQHQPPAPPQQQQQQHLQPPQLQQQLPQHLQQQQQPQQHPQGLPPSLNHHPTNPFIPIGVNLHSVSMASLVSQRGQSPVSSSTANSMVATPNSSGSGSGGGGGTSAGQASAVRKPTTLDTQLAILRREMYGLRQLDLSLLSQLWALNESIQEFRTMLQEQETLSPPSPTPSNSDANSVSSDEDEDDSSNTQTVGGIVGGIGAGAGGLLTNHNLIESVAAASVLSSSQTASSRMRAPPPPPPNRKAPSRPV